MKAEACFLTRTGLSGASLALRLREASGAEAAAEGAEAAAGKPRPRPHDAAVEAGAEDDVAEDICRMPNHVPSSIDDDTWLCHSNLIPRFCLTLLPKTCTSCVYPSLRLADSVFKTTMRVQAGSD